MVVVVSEVNTTLGMESSGASAAINGGSSGGPSSMPMTVTPPTTINADAATPATVAAPRRCTTERPFGKPAESKRDRVEPPRCDEARCVGLAESSCVDVSPEVGPAPEAPRASSTRSRSPGGAANAGAAPMSANGAKRRRVRSQVEHASTWRATRLRTSTENSPSQSDRIDASSSHSFRPRRATQ